VGIHAQEEVIDLVNRLGIREDIEKLDSLVARKARKLGYMNQFKELTWFHFFKLTLSDPQKELTKKDWLDYSFLNYLKPRYFRMKGKLYGRKYLDAHTFLVDKKRGLFLADFERGHFYVGAREMPNVLMSTDNTFIFMCSSDLQFRTLTRNRYIIVNENKFYVFIDSEYRNSSKELIPWDIYVKGMGSIY
jgi:hypothetical protein